MRHWFAIALLAGSWLFGTDFFQPANYWVWSVCLLAATWLLTDVPIGVPSRRLRILAMALALPALWWLSIPQKAIPLLLIIGLALDRTPLPDRWPRLLGRAAMLASLVLLVQSLTLEVYQVGTARGHELPTVLARPLLVATRLLGTDVTLDGSWIVAATAYGTERVAATWELLFDPASVAFAAGAIVLLILAFGRERGWAGLARKTCTLLVIVLLWAPLRAITMIDLILHQILRADAGLFPNVGIILVSSWTHFGLVVALALVVAMIFKRRVDSPSNAPLIATRARRSMPISVAVGLATTGVVILTSMWIWSPIGHRKAGRVLVVERHSTWEPTTEPYGTKVYGEAGSYNYAAIYAYCQQFYRMGRILESDPIDDNQLADCDVLIIKTPTARYSSEEVEAIVNFVRRGGSALLIGDHTNVFNMNTYLNDIGRRFGFTFRNDLLFKVGSPYKQPYDPPRIVHPILQDLPPMNFAVSCSIDPGTSVGTMAIRNTGLWNLPPAYQESNYHPQAEYRPYMQYGAWCQLWTTTAGRGRVAAFADSTLFSNFCVFQPGKRELFMGMLEWLNHTSPFDSVLLRMAIAIPCTLLGGLLAVAGWWFGQKYQGSWIVLVAAGLFGWTVASLGMVVWQRAQLPALSTDHPMQHIVIDRTLSDVPLFTGAFADAPDGVGYGMLEQWIPRIGAYISRDSGPEVFDGDGLVLICPTKLPDHDYRTRLVQWVHSGGKLLVVDTPDIGDSTANSILMLFGVQSSHLSIDPVDKPLEITGMKESAALQMTCRITGGEPIAQWNDLPAATRLSYGKGSVTVIGFGSLFNDAAMGFHWLAEPDQDVLKRYESLYALLRIAFQ